ncbi:MAG TPA: hypothetical protein VH370_13015, partial [Humisphaera sp.]|nr:hypothetical protein [Humisphaera sp.]
MSIQKRRQKRVKPLRQIQNHIGEARRSANVRQCPPLVEQVENRILFSSTFTRAITLLGIGNSGYDFAHDTNLKRDNDALQTAAGAASLAASYQPFNPVVQATAIVTNGFAFASGTAVLAEDIGHETPATITGDIFSLVGNAAGVAGGAVNLGAALDPDPASRAAADAISGAFDLVGAHAQIISIAAERGPAAAAAMQDYLRSLQNAVGYALNNVTVTASSQYKAALSAVQNALNASATVLANTGSSTFTGNAKSAANAFNQSVAPVNNFIAASKLPKVNDIVTVAPGSFSVTSNGSTLLKGTSTDTTSAGIETITASGQSGSVNFKSTNSINNASVVQTDTNTTTSLSVTAKILPSGQASETVTGPNGTADLSNAAINLGIGTSATVVGNGDTISESATGDKLTVYGNNNNTTLSGNSSSVTDHGTHDTDTLNGSNESAIVTGPNDTTYLQNSTDHVMHTGAGDTVTGPGANISVKINLGAWQPIQAYTHVGFIDHTVAVFSVNPSTAQVDASMFTATILWGDGTQSSGTVAADPSKATGFPFVVLGSHVYATSGDFPVTVTVNGPKGATARGQECSVDSISMPSAASNPATKPPVQSSTRPLTYVTIFPQAWQPLESYAGVGFKLNTVGVLSGSYDGAADTNIADYKVVINWGDSPSWTSGIVAADPSRATGFSIVLLGSHTYAASGDYPIVVNVTGPDGMTVAAQTSQCDVSAMPNHLPG